MTRPLLLDLFCGAGGAAMGYHRAGFDVIGVDLELQPNYPFEFVQADALNPPFDLTRFDAIHASPPCQAYAPVTAWRGRHSDHPDLLEPTADLLVAAGVPWVIENVPGAPREPELVLCGTQLGLRVRRHRWFWTSWGQFAMAAPCRHAPSDYAFDHGGKQPESVYRDAMGCEWMTVRESRNAIPPAYTELIGAQLIDHIHGAAT